MQYNGNNGQNGTALNELTLMDSIAVLTQTNMTLQTQMNYLVSLVAKQDKTIADNYEKIIQLLEEKQEEKRKVISLDKYNEMISNKMEELKVFMRREILKDSELKQFASALRKQPPVDESVIAFINQFVSKIAVKNPFVPKDEKLKETDRNPIKTKYEAVIRSAWERSRLFNEEEPVDNLVILPENCVNGSIEASNVVAEIAKIIRKYFFNDKVTFYSVVLPDTKCNSSIRILFVLIFVNLNV
jgi:hypothetical protein